MLQTRRTFLKAISPALPGALIAGSWLPSLGCGREAGPQATPLVEIAEGDEFDVCIVGSGPAGAILGNELAGHGIDTLLLESGPLSPGSRDPRFSELDAYSSSGKVYPIVGSRFRGAGGTSNLWTGSCTRFFPADLEPNAYTPAGAPWPIRYTDLEPFYRRADVELRVRGLEEKPFGPPRGTPHPLTFRSDQIKTLQALFANANLQLEQVPQSDWDGDPLRTVVTHLPSFSRARHGTLSIDATVTRILAGERGKIEGLEARTLDGQRRIVRARFYVLACGAIEAPRLLLLSRSTRFPNGIGNGSDLVGRRFLTHYDGVNVRGWLPAKGPMGTPARQAAVSNKFVAEAKSRGVGGVRLHLVATRSAKGISVLVGALMEMEPSLQNRVTLEPSREDYFGNPGARLSLAPSDRDLKTMRYTAGLVRKTASSLGLGDVQNSTKLTWASHHLMGGCPMGADPDTSVVDKDLKVHGTTNLYVAGSAPFVTCGVTFPTLTIAALSLRLADHLKLKLA